MRPHLVTCLGLFLAGCGASSSGGTTGGTSTSTSYTNSSSTGTGTTGPCRGTTGGVSVAGSTGDGVFRGCSNHRDYENCPPKRVTCNAAGSCDCTQGSIEAPFTVDAGSLNIFCRGVVEQCPF